MEHDGMRGGKAKIVAISIESLMNNIGCRMFDKNFVWESLGTSFTTFRLPYPDQAEATCFWN
jgi:hypothetical protein